MTTLRKSALTPTQLAAALILLVVVVTAFGFWAYVALVGLTTLFGVSMLGAAGIYVGYIVALFAIKVLAKAVLS